MQEGVEPSAPQVALQAAADHLGACRVASYAGAVEFWNLAACFGGQGSLADLGALALLEPPPAPAEGVSMAASRVVMHQIVLPSEVDALGICFGGQARAASLFSCLGATTEPAAARHAGGPCLIWGCT